MAIGRRQRYNFHVSHPVVTIVLCDSITCGTYERVRMGSATAVRYSLSIFLSYFLYSRTIYITHYVLKKYFLLLRLNINWNLKWLLWASVDPATGRRVTVKYFQLLLNLHCTYMSWIYLKWPRYNLTLVTSCWSIYSIIWHINIQWRKYLNN